MFDRRYAIAAAVGAKPGDTVADVGAGSGLFVRLFAPAVMPGGRVLAVDIAQVFVDNIVRSARASALDNVVGLRPSVPRFPPGDPARTPEGRRCPI